MRKIIFYFSLGLSFVVSLFISTNVFAYATHYSYLLGRPTFNNRLYEPFHLLFWSVTLHTTGNQFKIAYISLGVSFLLFSSFCFFVYTHSKANLLGIFGSTRWLTQHELKKTGALKPHGVILGQTKSAFYYHNNDKFTMLRKGKIIFNNDKEHILLVAPTRRGKGISIILTNLLGAGGGCGWSGSFVVFDMKKENFSVSAGWLRKFSHVLKYEPCSHDSIHINPLEEIDPGEKSFTQARIIAEQITNPDGETVQKADYWRDSAKDFITALILYAMGEQINPERKVRFSLPGIREYINNPAWDIHSVLNDLLKAKNFNVQQIARSMLNKADNELSGVIGSSNQYLSPYADPIVASNSEHSDFRLEELYSSDLPVSFFICLNPGELKANKALVRILLQIIANKMTEDLSPKKHRVLCIFDEFIALGRMPYYEEGLQFFAGYGMRLLIVCQSFKQLYGVYGKETSIIANCRFKAVLGSGDPDDSRLISDFLGTLSYNKESNGTSSTMGNFIAASRSKNITEAGRNLMSADDIFRMPYEDFLLLVDGSYPYKGKKLMYYLDPRFMKRANLKGAPDTREQQIKETPAYAKLLSERKKNKGKGIITHEPKLLPAPIVHIIAARKDISPFEEYTGSKAPAGDTSIIIPNPKETPAAPADQESIATEPDTEQEIPDDFGSMAPL
jgi:type IV secretion system protein VirD4